MRVLVLFAHPVETSFAAALHAKVVEVLRSRRHQVDDCDLYAEAFDPVMSRRDRIDYYDLAANCRNVGSYVERVLAAEAIVFSFPVWSMGFPAILKGFHRQGFPARRQLHSRGGRFFHAMPSQHQTPRGRLHLWRRALADDDDGRSAASFFDALDA